MKGAPAAFAASNATRLNDTGLEAFMADYALGGLKETSQSKIWNLPFSNPLNGTLDGWLLNHWFEDLELNDALFLQSVGDNSSVSTPLSRPRDCKEAEVELGACL